MRASMDERTIQEAAADLGVECRVNEPLGPHTTMGVGGPAGPAPHQGMGARAGAGVGAPSARGSTLVTAEGVLLDAFRSIGPLVGSSQASIVRELAGSGTHYRVLGAGSNLIIADEGVRSPVISSEKLAAGVQREGNRVRAGAEECNGTVDAAAHRDRDTRR